MGQAMRRMTGKLSSTNTLCIFTNQIREKVGVYYGSNETTPGGRALKFAASVRLQLQRVQSIKKGDAEIGSRIRARVVKNKVGPPFRKAEFDITDEEGISVYGDLLDLAVDRGLVKRSGSWYSFAGEQIGQGRDAAKLWFGENLEAVSTIRNTIQGEVG
jgi:recombination protein RecA